MPRNSTILYLIKLINYLYFSKKTNNYEFIKRNLDFYSWDA